MGGGKLYKSRDKKICGVCGGIAEFFRLDPTFVRMIYLVLSVVYGSGILVYIIAAVIMDNKPDYIE
ncbi:MAG: PspC domain-containing protein [Butyrivibrio sp.]|nr:PspC domain-containing protein [Butyrivibrio sp.]